MKPKLRLGSGHRKVDRQGGPSRDSFPHKGRRGTVTVWTVFTVCQEHNGQRVRYPTKGLVEFRRKLTVKQVESCACSGNVTTTSEKGQPSTWGKGRQTSRGVGHSERPNKTEEDHRWT